MNISCHSFVPTRSFVNQYNQKLNYFDYIKTNLSIPLVPFPRSGDSYRYRTFSDTTLINITPPFLVVPYLAYDITEPKAFILTLY